LQVDRQLSSSKPNWSHWQVLFTGEVKSGKGISSWVSRRTQLENAPILNIFSQDLARHRLGLCQKTKHWSTDNYIQF
jgi:hypothetical protein